MSKFVDARVSRRFTLLQFQPLSRARATITTSATTRFPFRFPFHPLAGEKRKEESFQSTNRARISFLSWFFFTVVRSWSIHTLTLHPRGCNPLSLSVRGKEIFLFFPSCINSRTRCFTLQRISSPSPIRFLLASIPERDRLDDLPSMWKQKKEKYRFVRGNESKCSSWREREKKKRSIFSVAVSKIPGCIV